MSESRRDSAGQLLGASQPGNREHAALLLVVLGLVVVPLLYLTGNMEIVQVNMLGRYLCFAIVAVSLDLIWGYTGLLCLCQSLFFALGGYAMGMYLAHHGGPEGIIDATGDWKIPACLYVVYPGAVGETEADWLLPFFWKPFYFFEFTVILGLLIPGLVAMVIGFFVFRSRVRGVFFAILTQALTLAFWLVFSMNKMKLCGTNGLTRFETVGPFFTVQPGGLMPGLVIATTIVLGLNLLLLFSAILKRLRRNAAPAGWRDPWRWGLLAGSLLGGLVMAFWLQRYVAVDQALRDLKVDKVLARMEESKSNPIEEANLDRLEKEVLSHLKEVDLYHLKEAIVDKFDEAILVQIQEAILVQVEKAILDRLDKDTLYPVKTEILAHLEKMNFDHLDKGILHPLREAILVHLEKVILNRLDKEILYPVKEAVLVRIGEAILYRLKEVNLDELKKVNLDQLEAAILVHLEEVNLDLDKEILNQLEQVILVHLEKVNLDGLDKEVLDQLDKEILDQLETAIFVDLEEVNLDELKKVNLDQLEAAILADLEEVNFDGLDSDILYDVKQANLDELKDPGVKFVLYLVTVVVLLDIYLFCRYIVQSRLGRVLVAVRDKENRLRFSGYKPHVYKVFIFAVSAMIAGLGGMLYAPQMGIFTPTNMEPKESILVVIWVAVGGRGSLSGPIIGALAVNLIYNYLTGSAPETWPFLQGALFIAVVLARPDGLVSLKRDIPWYRRALERFRDFRGRSGRQEFWYFTVFHMFFVLLLTAAAMLVDPNGFMQVFTGEEVIKTPNETMKTITWVLRLVLLAYAVLILVPLLAVSFRRIQDTGVAAWWLLIAAVPLTAWLVLPMVGLDPGVVVGLLAFCGVLGVGLLMSRPSQPTANRYGQVPDLGIAAGEVQVEEQEEAESLDMQERLRRVANLQRIQTDKSKIQADILSIHDLTVVFDGFKALDIDEFHLPHYMLQVIIGPNGAGKTTLCDVISGKTRPTTGRVIFNGEDITEASEADIALKGVGRKFQTPTIYDSLTVYQNMELALPDSQGLAHNLLRITSSEQHDRIYGMLKRVRMDDDANRLVKFLSHGQRQWLEISMLILSDPELLLVDEPAAGLTDEETVLTAELLLELQEDHSVIVIEHDMEFVRMLNAPVVVLNEGLIMASGTMEEVQADERVVEAYLGR